MHPNELRHPVVALRRRRIMPAWVQHMDDRAGGRVNRRKFHPALDRGLTRLSKSADRGLLWFAIAAALFLFGQRRAALRGAGSLIVSSLIANLIGKNVFGGDRPLLNNVPIGRRLKKHPTSPSFPSGHAASAAGFVAGAAWESPRSGAALTPLAVAVSYSRLHTGAHWLSDVLGGVSLGLVVGTTGKLLFPARRKARPQPTAASIPLPALAHGRGLLMLINPSSGQSVRRPDPRPELTRRLPEAVLHELRNGESMAGLARKYRPRVLGVYGGDGSAAAAAQVARRRGIPLLVIPGGTFNHFAGTAGIATVGDAIDALQRGEGRRVDVGELSFQKGEPITVLNTASVGVYPYFVAEREKREKRIGKPLAAFVASLGVLPMADPIRVTINGSTHSVWSVFVGVNRYFPQTAAPLQRRRLDDGVLDVRILHADRGRARSSAIRALSLGTPRVVEGFTTESFEVRVRARHGHDPGFAHDGEASLKTPGGSQRDGSYLSSIRIVPGGLEIYSPRHPAKG